MSPKIEKLLFDMRYAAVGIRTFIEGKSLETFQNDLVFRLAVERQFEIIGEAMARLTSIAPEFADRITDRRKIISFRNVIAHGYDIIDYAQMWRIIHEELPTLEKELKILSNEP